LTGAGEQLKLLVMKPSLVHRSVTRGVKLFSKSLSAYAAWRQRRGSLPHADRARCIFDIPFSDRGGKQSVDVYLPQAPPQSSDGYPFVLFVHGGGWISGDRKMAAPVGNILAANGIAVVALGYRLAPRVGIADQLADLQDGLRLVHEKAAGWQLEVDRWAIAGESAGAHLAMRLAQELLSGLPRPRAIIGLYGLYDLSVWQRHSDRQVSKVMLDNLCGEQSVAELVEEQTALRQLPWTDVPVLLIHGESDRLAGAGESHKLAHLLREQGIEVSLITYPGTGHAFIYMPRRYPEEVRSCFETMVSFLDAHLGGEYRMIAST
jgi:acetyl esterase/lipase